MITSLSDSGNEKLLCEWSGTITDKHAQDFCDVCNAVFHDHFDIDFIRRKYERNLYGDSFIVILYKDDSPVAAEGAWRNDVNGRISFQICDTATVPSMRKRGYNTKIASTILTEIKAKYPDALVYRFPGPMSWRMSEILGLARTKMYLRMYTGSTKDFQENMPIIDDEYVESFFLNREGAFIHKTTYRGGGGKTT